MYIRIQPPSIRYRISRAEAEELLAEKILCDTLTLAPDYQISYRILCTEEQSQFESSLSSQCLQLSINRLQLEDEITDRPSKTGISFRQQLVGCDALTIALEVDLKNKRKD